MGEEHHYFYLDRRLGATVSYFVLEGPTATACRRQSTSVAVGRDRTWSQGGYLLMLWALRGEPGALCTTSVRPNLAAGSLAGQVAATSFTARPLQS